METDLYTELEKLHLINLETKKQPDPYQSNKTLYNPTTGDLYITSIDDTGRVRRNVINLLSD